MDNQSSALDITPEPEPPYARMPGEPLKAFETFSLYRDMRPMDRSMRTLAAQQGKHPTLYYRWSSEWDWVARVIAWDRDMERIAVQAHKDEIERINRRHAQIAETMLDAVEHNMPAIDRSLARSPRTAVEMFTAAVKVQRDAAGIADPAKTTIVAGDPDNPIQHDVDIAGVFSNMPPELVLKARELSIEWTKAQAREQAGLPPAPAKEASTTEA